MILLAKIQNILIHKFSKFFYLGLMSYGLKIILTAFLTEFMKIDYFYSYIATLSVIIVLNFYFNMCFVFKNQKEKLKNIFRYSIALVIMYFLDLSLVKFLTDNLGIHYLFSIVIVTVFLFVLKYFVYDKLVFK
jgi:putative flippase GtrA